MVAMLFSFEGSFIIITSLAASFSREDNHNREDSGFHSGLRDCPSWRLHGAMHRRTIAYQSAGASTSMPPSGWITRGKRLSIALQRLLGRPGA
jgi:hypothetical protein